MLQIEGQNNRERKGIEEGKRIRERERGNIIEILKVAEMVRG